MKDKPKKTAGWEIPEHVKESFTDFCKRVGTLAKEDCAGALFAWQYLPAHLRERAKLNAKEPLLSKDTEAFWTHWNLAMDDIIERGLLNALLGLPTGDSSRMRAFGPQLDRRNAELYVALAEYLRSQPVGLSQDLDAETQEALDTLRVAWEHVLEQLGLDSNSLPQRLRDLAEAAEEQLGEETVTDALAIEAEQTGKKAGTPAKGTRSRKSPGRGRKTG